MLTISQKILDDICRHALETYPEECCGILVGADNGEDRTVTEAHRSKNVSEERRHDRYLIDPLKIIEIDKSVRKTSLSIVGFYHSHPDYPSRPSQFDTDQAAWPGYSYLIVSLEKSRVVSAQAWVMPDGKNVFEEQPVKIEAAP